MKDRAYHRDYSRSYYHVRKQKCFEILGAKCVKCGSIENLQFDHIDRASKSFPIGKLLNKRWSEVLKELEKCQVLCQPCHSIKTTTERGLRIAKGSHGTTSTRRYCACELCRKAVRDYVRKRKGAGVV